MVSIVVLTRNEGHTIGPLLHEILAKVRKPFEILVVDDSTDDTAEVVQGFSSAHENIRLLPQEGKGYTRALTTAVKYFLGDAMVVLVGDGSDEIADIDRMREKRPRLCLPLYARRDARTGCACSELFLLSCLQELEDGAGHQYVRCQQFVQVV
jgi:glycosyltransferase involved in cell wall biosynthesis